MTHIKRILHVVGAMNRGGTETLLMNIYRKLDHKHVQFDFISYSSKESHYDQEIEQLGGRVFRLTKTNSVKQIYDVIKRHGKYDAVHAHTLFHCGIVCIAARLAGVKIRISHAHTTKDNNETYIKRIYISTMSVVINFFSTQFLACSRGAGRYLFNERNLRKANYAHFPNVIDYAKFLKVPQKHINTFKVEEGLGSHLIVGHIGTFKSVKNHQFLLEIMKCFNERSSPKLLLVGDGELREQIKDTAIRAEIHNNIRFLGIREDIPTILHSMDVFVFPSIYEGLGLVLLEAQACGVPCIVSEAIQPEADLGLGLITKLSLADGPEIWAEKIIELANEREKDTNKIVAHFEGNGYSLKKGIATLMQLYQVNMGGQNETDTNRVL